MSYKKPAPIQAEQQPSKGMWLAADGWHWPEVYAMRLLNKGAEVAIKVGMSFDVEGRCVDLQYEHCGPNLNRTMEIVARYECKQARDVERQAHKLLKESRIEGEWFSCSAEEAAAAIEKANKMVNR